MYLTTYLIFAYPWTQPYNHCGDSCQTIDTVQEGTNKYNNNNIIINKMEGVNIKYGSGINKFYLSTKLQPKPL